MENKINEAKLKQQQEAAEAPPLRVACTGWSSDDVRALDAMCQGSDFPKSIVQREIARDLKCPCPPSEPTRQAMADCDD
eukprot:2217496-Pyramimonas_sp.AAC.1